MPKFDSEKDYYDGFVTPLTAGKPKGEPGAPVANSSLFVADDPLKLIPGGAGKDGKSLVSGKK